MTTLAQAYLLLLLDDESGKPLITGAYLKYGLAGALLADLALAGRIELEGKTSALRAGQLAVTDPSPLGDAVADTTLRELAADKPRGAHAVISKLGHDVRPRVVDQLVDARILRREQGRVLGIFPVDTWPASSTRFEQEVRERLRRELLTAAAPSGEMAALAGLLKATGGLAKALPGEDRRELSAGAKRVAAATWQPEAARDTIQAIIKGVQSVTSSSTASGASYGA